jgi:hypothetical protein
VMKLDISILENCRRFNIPTFIVRSKADNHIRQTMKKLRCAKEPNGEKESLYTKACEMFVNDTRRNLEETLRSANLPDQRVYIISSDTLRQLASVKHSDKIIDELIDEGELIQDVLQAAYDRRYSAPHETHARHARLRTAAAAKKVIEALHF